jgi:hypothetical protein
MPTYRCRIPPTIEEIYIGLVDYKFCCMLYEWGHSQNEEPNWAGFSLLVTLDFCSS